MGAAHSFSNRNDELLRYIRGLDSPESALLNERALSMVDCSFVSRNASTTAGVETEEDLQSSVDAEGKDAADVLVETENVAEEKVQEEVDEYDPANGDSFCETTIVRMSGRKNNVVPFLYCSMLYGRRLIVLEHILVVLLERKSNPGIDAFFAESPSNGSSSRLTRVTLAPEYPNESIGNKDISITVLSALCTSALSALQSVGTDVAQPVVDGLRETMMAMYDDLGICSLGSETLDESMDFLLENFDENENINALEALCIIAAGRGSVYYLLQLAWRLLHSAELSGKMRPIYSKLLEKCNDLESGKKLGDRDDDRSTQCNHKMIRINWRRTINQDEDEDEDEEFDIGEEYVDLCKTNVLTTALAPSLTTSPAEDGPDISVLKGIAFLDQDCSQFAKMPLLNQIGQKIVRIACSAEHVIALGANGDVFALGDNKYGQCGLPSTSNLVSFEKLNINFPIRQVAVGDAHSLFLAENSTTLLSCGRNQCGQLGLGNTSTQPVPEVVRFAVTKRITLIDAGGVHSVIVRAENEIYGFGLLKAKVTMEPTLLVCCEATSRVVAIASASAYCVALEESLLPPTPSTSAGAPAPPLGKLGTSTSSPNLLAVSGPSTPTSQKKKRRKKRKKMFRLITCLVETPVIAIKEMKMFHWQSSSKLLAREDDVLAIIREVQDTTPPRSTDEDAQSPATLKDSSSTVPTADLENLEKFSPEDIGAGGVLLALEKFPPADVKEKFENTRLLLHILEKLHNKPDLAIPALRVLQKHCFVPSSPSDDNQVTMRDMKQFLFKAAKSTNCEIKEEAIRAIGNGFAFLSPTATELATFMSTITNMTYLSRFATLKFWSELFSQELQQDTAIILIERLIDLAVNDPSKLEVIDLLMAMQRCLLLQGTEKHDLVNKYASALAKASTKLLKEANGKGDHVDSLGDSILKSLMWPGIVMLQHPHIELDSCVDDLLLLLKEVDRVCWSKNLESRHWLRDMEWGVVVVLIGKICATPNAPEYPTMISLNNSGRATDVIDEELAMRPARTKQSALVLGKRTTSSHNLMAEVPPLVLPTPKGRHTVELNLSIFSSGFCESELYNERIVKFQQIIQDADCEVMSKVSKMNLMKFRNKEGAETVWRALRAIYAAIRIFDRENLKLDAANSAMKILRWMNQTKQALEDVNYEMIGNHVVHRVRFLLKMNNISDHSLLQFAQQYDQPQLAMYEQAFVKEKLSIEREMVAFQVLTQMLQYVSTPSVKRHVIFSFTEFATSSKYSMSQQRMIEKAVDVLVESTEDESGPWENPVLVTAMIDLCVVTKQLNKPKFVKWLLKVINFEAGAKTLAAMSGSGSPGNDSTGEANASAANNENSSKKNAVFRDAQSMVYLPDPSGLPLTLGIQWSRQYKHPDLKLSRNGLCFHLPPESPKSASFGHTAATIRLTHALHTGRFYFQLTCTPGSMCPEGSLVLLAIGLVPSQYNEWDGFININCVSICNDPYIGLFVDLDAGVCTLMRHQNRFYRSDTMCYLYEDSVIFRQKITTKQRPLYPAFSLLSSGATALLKKVVVENDTTKIFTDEAQGSSRKLQVLGGSGRSFRSTSSSLNLRALANGSEQDLQQQQQQQDDESSTRPGEQQINPEQDEDDDEGDEKSTIVISGPLNLGLTEETELLVCGQNSYGELGVGDTKPHRDMCISNNAKGLFPIQVVAGNEVTGILTDRGEVFVWGYNKNGGCGKPADNDFSGMHHPGAGGVSTSSSLGSGDMSGTTGVNSLIPSSPKAVIPPARVPLPHRVNIPTFVTRLCCSNGSEHMLAITSSGHVYGWGFNQYGQLGLGHKYERILQPTRVEGALVDKKVTFAATSYSHSLVLTEDGILYGFGLNTRGQLGIGSTADMWTLPQCLSHLAEIGRVVSMSCGVEHSAVCMEDGSLYTFGRNDCGQLGIDDMTKQLSSLPVRVADGLSKLSDLRCEAVACGYYFTVVIADGTLHAFGKNDFGQLGVGHNHEVFAPVPVLWNGDDDRFVAVTCGTGHSIAVTTYGRIIAWGRNKDGGVGNGTTVDHPFPVEICNKGEMSLSLRDQRPLYVAAGFHHTCVLVGSRRDHTIEQPINEAILWPVRSLTSSCLAFRRVLSYSEGDRITIADWALNQLHEQTDLLIFGEKPTSLLCRRHNAAPVTLCCLSERCDQPTLAWINGICALGVSDPRLYANQILSTLLDTITKCEIARDHVAQRSDSLELFFKIACTSGSAVRSCITFDILSNLLPSIPTAKIPNKFSIRQLLLRIGLNEDMAISAQIVALLRLLLTVETNDWQACINRALLCSLALQIPRLPDDIEDLSVFAKGGNRERMWAMMGALQVLGASDEVLYDGAPVSIVANDVDGQEGVLDWYRPIGGFQTIAKVSFPAGNSVLVQKHNELVPRPKLPLSVQAVSRPEKILSLLVSLVQQNVDLVGNNADISHVKAACLHEVAKARASKVIDIMLREEPSMVQLFVSNGHLQAVTSLLAAPRGRLDSIPLRTLQQRFLDLEIGKRKLESGESKGDSSDNDLEGADVGASWVCNVCNYQNQDPSGPCSMCFSTSSVQKPSTTPGPNSKNGSGEAPPAPPALSAEAVDKALISHPSGSTLRELNSPQTEQLSCSWSFENGMIPETKRIRVKLVNELGDLEKEQSNQTQNRKSYLTVPNGSYLVFDHSFCGNGSEGSVYLNQYSIIVDVCIPAKSFEHDFIAILQTNTENDSLADWYVKGDGSVGCIQYSEPGILKPDTWTRLVMTADLTNRSISYFVNGEKQVTLLHQGPTKHILLLEDDRWALDSSFCLFRDVDQVKDAPEVEIARIQLRSYVMSESEIKDLGEVGSNGVSVLPLPNVSGLASRLSKELKLPKAWCVRALRATRHRLPRARNWLRANEQALIARTVAEARMLTALGYSRKLCAHAICTTSSLADAIHWLLDNEGIEDYSLKISRIMQECSKDDSDMLLSNDMLAINLAEDDQDAHNKTYEIYDSTNTTSDSLLGDTSDLQKTKNNRLSLPPLGCGIRQFNAELWETARQLFVSHARQATVSILENSLLVQSSDNYIIENMQEKLLAVDGTGRNFLRNYLRAFPDSIRKDIRSGTMAHEIDRGDPIQVLRRKLLMVFSQEVEKRIVADATKIPWPEVLETWWKSQSSHDLEEGTKVWWLQTLDDGVKKVRHGAVVSTQSKTINEPVDAVDDATAMGSTTGSAAAATSGQGDSSNGNTKLELYQQQQEEFQQLAKVLYDFAPQRKGDLSIRKGDTVVVLGATKSGWGRARDLKTGAIGTIPLNYVDAIGEEYDPSGSATSTTTPALTSHQSTTMNVFLKENSRREKRLQKVVVVEDEDGVQESFSNPDSELLTDEPPQDACDPRVNRTIAEKAEEDAWKSSVLRSLSEDVLHELVLLARGPWQFLPGGLQAGPSVQFQEIWCDEFTVTTEQVDTLTKKKKEVTNKRNASVRLWRPFADSGFSILGDVATNVSGIGDDRPPPVTVVSDDDGMGGKTTTSSGLPLLVRPVRFKLIWQDTDAENDAHISFWQPVPPEGYVALGCVAVKGHSKREPDPKKEGLQQLRCVHESCVQPSTLQHGLWSYRPGDNKQEDDETEHGAAVDAEDPKTIDRSTQKSGDRLKTRSSKPASFKSGVSLWEIDNSSRTFFPVVAKHESFKAIARNKEKSKLLSLNRVDASTIESRLCVESQKKSNEEDTKARMLHGLKLTTKESAGFQTTKALTASVENASDELRPFHLGLASTSNSNHGSSELLLWILQLFSEFDSNEKNGMGRWAKRVFSPQLVHALLRFSRTATPLVRIKAIRMLAMVIRRTPADSLCGKLGHELLELRVQMESLYKRQAQKPKDGLMDEMPLFSSLLCALTEVFVSVSLTQRQPSLVNQSQPSQSPLVPDREGVTGEEDSNTQHEYFKVTFEGPLGIEILSNKDILIVHTVKPAGAAAAQDVQPGDIFWELNGKRVSEFQRHVMWTTIKSARPLTVTFLRDNVVYKSLAARQDETASQPADLETQRDFEATNPLSSEENWFQQLSELAAIMEALVHRGRVRMPSEFLMAEDTFLKLVLANHTAVVESFHPFSSKMVQGHVTIPGAEALVVRFDRRCSTPFGKTLQLSCNVQLNNTKRNVHVETLQGCFGGCSVHVPSSTMLYQFPIIQTMNWGLHRTADFKAPEIRVSNNGRTATLRKDKVWQTVFSTTGFNSGINMWEVRVDRTGPSANIFFGVAMKTAKVSNYLGCDDKGWGWIGCMACWHGGRKVRHKFGRRLKAGDIVRITLDIPRRAMSIACNGDDWGVAFNRLPLPSTVLKPGNELVPTFSFYNKDDQITLLSGSTACDLDTAGILHQLRSNFEQQHATARITSRFGGSENNGSSNGRSRRRSGSRGSRDAEGGSSSSSRRSSRRSLTRQRSLRRRRWSDNEESNNSGGGGDESTTTTTRTASGTTAVATSTTSNASGTGTDSQVEDQAVILSALGYPVEWCVQALNATENDMNRAAEYLINHSDRMAEESKQEAERAAVEAEEAVIAEEEEWLAQVNSMLDLDQQEMESKSASISDGGAKTTAAAALAALQSAASSRIMQREQVIASTADEEPESRKSRKTDKRKGSSGSTKEWGYRMTISPLFSRETTKQIAMEPKNAQRLDVFHKMFENLTLEHDCELVRMVNDICSKQGEDPLTLSPNDLEPTKDEIRGYKLLVDVPLLHLQLRFLVLRNFNRRLAHVLPLIDLSCAAHESALAASLRAVRGVVMSSVKKALFERVLADSHSGDDHWMQQNKVPTVTLDRNKAAQFLKSGRVDNKGTRTVFGQLFSQLHGNGTDEKSEKNPLIAHTPAVKDASLLRNSHRAWYTILAGERADDYGGPYRDVFNQACQELLTSALPLFLPCPNQITNQGLNRGKWLPAATATSHTSLCMYEFVGKLMGISMRTKNPFVLDLPSFVWKQLCNDQVDLGDLKACDLDFFVMFSSIMKIKDEDELQKLDLKFTMKGSDGRFVELVPGGNSTSVTLARRDDYLKAFERARLHELDRQCAAIARGLGTQVPRNLLSIFTAEELELMVCGPPEVDIAILKLNTIYGDGINENTPSVQLFWQVMEEFTQDEKQKYLRFVWGRSRLPSSSQEWERKHKINKFNKSPADELLPTSHTCFFSVDLPMYSSASICREKLLYAISTCISIDMDETTVARQAAEGHDWLHRNEEDEDEEDDE